MAAVRKKTGTSRTTRAKAPATKPKAPATKPRAPAAKGKSAATKRKAAAAKAPARPSSRTPTRRAATAASRTSAPAKKRAAGKKAPLKSRRPTPRPRKKAAAPARAPAAENPRALALARAIAAVAVDKKALDVTIIDTRERGSEVGYDYVVVASGESERQLEAISDGVDEALRPQGTRPLSVSASPEWVLTDYGDVVAHFFTPDQRGHYDIEGLWATAPRVPVEVAPGKRARSR